MDWDKLGQMFPLLRQRSVLHYGDTKKMMRWLVAQLDNRYVMKESHAERPAPKFKVGDKVKYIWSGGVHISAGVVTEVAWRDGEWIVHHDGSLGDERRPGLDSERHYVLFPGYKEMWKVARIRDGKLGPAFDRSYGADEGYPIDEVIEAIGAPNLGRGFHVYNNKAAADEERQAWREGSRPIFGGVFDEPDYVVIRVHIPATATCYGPGMCGSTRYSQMIVPSNQPIVRELMEKENEPAKDAPEFKVGNYVRVVGCKNVIWNGKCGKIIKPPNISGYLPNISGYFTVEFADPPDGYRHIEWWPPEYLELIKSGAEE